MVSLCSDEGNDGQNDNATRCSLSNSSELEQDDQLGLTMSELEMEFDKMSNKLTLILDFKQENDSRIPSSELCPCGNKLVIPNHISFISPNTKFPGHCIGCGNKVSDSPSIFYGTASLFNIPMSLKSSAFSLEIQGKRRRSRSITNVSDFILESSLLFQFGVLDRKRSQPKLASANTKVTKSSELSRQSSELNISERKIASCSSTQSTCSNPFSKGLLSCVWKNGIPYFVFSLDIDCGDIFVANLQIVESSIDKALDYVYLFSSRNYKNHRNNSSGVVGKMRVSSSLVLNSNMSKFMETKFVLFGCHEDYLKVMKNSSNILTKRKCLSKKVAEILRSSHTFKHKATHKFGESNFQFDDQRFEELDSVHQFIRDFSPNLELAAIVVKDYQWKCNKEVSTGGWGLKFLEKPQVSDLDNSEEDLFSRKQCEGNFRRKINVIVPEGFHGGPNNRKFGPFSLIERWKSDGYCDCGGWDVGCPLRVLNNYTSSNLIKEDTEEDCQPVCLFVEPMHVHHHMHNVEHRTTSRNSPMGTNHGEQTLRMVNKSKGLYLVNFHSSLSALQAFSIAVAIIHSRTPELYPKF